MRYIAAAIGLTFATADVRRVQADRRACNVVPDTSTPTPMPNLGTRPTKTRPVRRGTPRFTRPASV
jgi:hypothetical protein